MPLYYSLRFQPDIQEKNRTIEGLLRLKESLDTVPIKTIDKNILIATWNIREFDADAYGLRSQEAMLYIAEIIDHFDLVAIQEVRDNLKALERLQEILGKWWKVVFTDVTEGKPGNRERLAFLYDSRKLSFTGLSGEIVIPPIPVKENGKTVRYDPSDQLYRTPFVVGFQAGWFKFMIATVHIAYGENKGDSEQRVKEIKLLSDFLAKRVRSNYSLYKNLIILGDFNIFKTTNQTFKEISKNFTIPKELQELPSNAIKNKHYDQIGYKFMDEVKMTNAGVFDFYSDVYRLEDEAEYIGKMGKAYDQTSKGKARDKKGKTSYYKTYWRTHQMSDHLPMWAEFEIDFSQKYLKGLLPK